MGKKRQRATYVSKGIVGSSAKSRLRHFDEGYESQRIMNQLKAHMAGKRVMLTIANPNTNETNKPFIRVPSTEVWKGSRR